MDTSAPTADHDLLIEVNTNVKNLTQTVNAHIVANSDKTTDHENRLRVLEAAQSQVVGSQESQKRTINIVSIIGGLISVGLALVIFIRG